MARSQRVISGGEIYGEEGEARAAFAGSNIDDLAKAERARRAFQYMRDRMVPSLAPYARSRTRNNALKVELTAGTPRTDGKTIWLRPDPRLGDNLLHAKAFCGQRDRYDMQLCEACRVNEGVYATMTHEISHMVEGSFEKIDPADDRRIQAILVRAENECATEARKIAIQRRFEKRPPDNYAEASSLISPWLLMLVNALEDARVNTAAYKAGPGLYKIFRADLNAILVEGIHTPEGEVVMWRDQPVEAQMCVAMYVKCSQMADYKEFFVSEVVEVLDKDPEIVQYLRHFGRAKSIEAIFELSVKILERLRELGYLRRPEENAEEEAIEQELKIGVLMDGEPEDGEGAGEDFKPDIIIDLRSKPEKADDSPADKSSSAGQPDDDAKADDKPSTSGSSMSAPSGADDAAGDPTGAGADSDDDSDTDDDRGDEPAGGGGADDSDDDDEWEEVDGDGDDDDDDFDYGDDDDYDSRFDDDDSDDDDEGSSEADSGDEMDAGAGTSGSSSPYGGDTPPELDIDLVKRLLEKIGRHEAKAADEDMEREISRAITQGDWLDEASTGIFGVRFIQPQYGDNSYRPVVADTEAVSAASWRVRSIFSENRKDAMQTNLRAGRINNRVLGKRAPVGDDHLFQRRRMPGTKSYFVLIGMDLSGSTSGHRSVMIKTAALNQANLLTAAGIPFAMFGHTGSRCENWSLRSLWNVDIYVVKDAHERWDDDAVSRLNHCTPQSANLDGHTLEVYRKIIERQRADKKLIMYYTDGAMPLENYGEELAVLRREIGTCRRLGIEIIGVGIENDDPTEHGLETVRVDDTADLQRVLDELEKKVTR